MDSVQSSADVDQAAPAATADSAPADAPQSDDAGPFVSEAAVGRGDALPGRRDGIRVVVRVRPLTDQENCPPRDYKAVESLDDGQTVALGSEGGTDARTFTFHTCKGPSTTQQEFFADCGIRQLLDSAMAGYSCTAFAFGQTGSGKTHTITGPDDERDDGILQRSIAYLWQQVGANPEINFRFSASYLEIYNEQVVDLLHLRPDRGALPVRWHADRGFHVENLLQVECDNDDTMLRVVEEGLRNRVVASHQMNDRSSRSHTILTINIESTAKAEDEDELADPAVIRRHGSIAFVDLAGSERVERTKSDGQTLVESNNINKSLLILGNCISSLADPRKRKGHIPYRDSVLTMLLKDSLGGSGMTLMVACISPAASSLSETQNTLRYASRAKRIQNKPIVRMDPQQQMIQALKREVRMLRKECVYLRNQIDSGSELGTSASLFTAKDAIRGQALLAAYGRDGTHAGTATVTGGEIDSDVLANMARELTQAKVMLQQYMQENEDLRLENVTLYSQQQVLQMQHEQVERENAQMIQQLRKAHLEVERATNGGRAGGRAGNMTSFLPPLGGGSSGSYAASSSSSPKSKGRRRLQVTPVKAGRAALASDSAYLSSPSVRSGRSGRSSDTSALSLPARIPGPTEHVTEAAHMAAAGKAAKAVGESALVALANVKFKRLSMARTNAQPVTKSGTMASQPRTPAAKKGGKKMLSPPRLPPPTALAPSKEGSGMRSTVDLLGGGRLDHSELLKGMSDLDVEIARAEAQLAVATSQPRQEPGRGGQRTKRKARRK